MPVVSPFAAVLFASTLAATHADVPAPASSAASAAAAPTKGRSEGHSRSDSKKGRHRREHGGAHTAAASGAKTTSKASSAPAAAPAAVVTPAKANKPLPPVPPLALSLPASLPKNVASKDEGPKNEPKASEGKSPCMRPPVLVSHGHEAVRVSLTHCDGSAASRATESVGLLVKNEAPVGEGRGAKHELPVATRLDGRVLERLQLVVDHFEKDGKQPHVVLLAAGHDGQRGRRARSIDFRLEGVPSEDVLAYCHTLADTGCGFYPAAGSLHLEVRERGQGRVAWVDASGSANTSSLPALAASIREKLLGGDEPAKGSDRER